MKLRDRSILALLPLLSLALPLNGYAHDLSVDCDAGDSLAAAVEQADANTAILVHGFCNEAIVITKDGITLDGLGHDGTGSATISGAGIFTSTDVVLVDGVQRVVLKGISIQDGIFGLALQRGAAAALESVSVKNNQVMGINVADHSLLETDNVEVTNNGVNGIEVIGNSHVTATKSLVVNDNTVFGIDVIHNSSIRFREATANVHGNVVGVQVGITSSGFIEDDGTLLDTSDNDSIGLTVVSTSSFFVFAGTVMSNNNGNNDGVALFSNSSIDLDRTASIYASNNGRDGILLENSLLNIVQMPGESPDVTVNGNARNGISAIQNASVDFVGESTLTALNNQQGGVLSDNGSTVRLVNAVVKNNGKRSDVVLTFGGRADITNSNIDSLQCDGTHLLRGDIKKCHKIKSDNDD
jgi:hypothetical protein